MSDNPHPALTLRLRPAAQLLGLNPSTLRARAASGDIPGAKPGRSWVFIEADLLSYMRGQYVEKVPCRSTNVKGPKSGGSTSAMPGSGYVGRLEQLIEQRRKKSITTSK